MFENPYQTNRSSINQNKEKDKFFDAKVISPTDQFFKPAYHNQASTTIQTFPEYGVLKDDAVSFNVIAPDPQLIQITDRVNTSGQYFSLGGGGGPEWKRRGEVIPAEPYLFSWNAQVQIPASEHNNWVVGMLQTVKAWYIEIIWGQGTSQVKCGDTFNNLHDGFDAMTPWYQDAPSGFNTDGMSDKIKIDDSPTIIIPYTNPNTPSEAFGYFDFSVSFITYISAFNKSLDLYDPQAYRHLKSVRWKIAIKGSFDGRGPNQPTVQIKSGGTTMDNVKDGFNEEPPVIGGMLAIDEIAKVLKCWTGYGK